MPSVDPYLFGPCPSDVVIYCIIIGEQGENSSTPAAKVNLFKSQENDPDHPSKPSLENQYYSLISHLPLNVE